MISPVVLHGCKTWSSKLREKHRLRVYKKSVLRKVFGFNRDEVTGKLHNGEIRDLFCGLNNVSVMK
jgi:hypothetical protein